MTKVSDIPIQAGLPVSPAKQSVSTNEDNKDFLEMMANTSMDVFPSDTMSMASTNTRKGADLGSTNGSDFLDFNVSDSSKINRIEKSESADAKPVISKEDTKKIKDAVEKYEKDVTTAIKEELDVSDEQIEAAMETLGLTFVDLSDPANMAKLIGELNGSEDTVNLLTSTALTDLIEDVGVLTDGLVEVAGLELQDIKQVTDGSIDLQAVGMEVLDTPVELSEEISNDLDKSENSLHMYQNNINAKDNADTRELPEEETEEPALVINNPEDEKTDTGNNKMDNSSSDTSSGNQGAKQPGNTTENNVEIRTESNISYQQVNTEVVEAAPEVNSYVSVDTQNVIEQIVTAARTQITATVRSMELELNPMNLGRMLMQVTEENGQITARIFTQNEAVKEALESQMALLKDQLSEQGIKVEAVEISVATHEFEQNLEEGQDGLLQDELARQQEEENKQTRRGINLGDPELMGEEPLTEEEELTARIMKDEGNMVNFRA